MKTLCRLLSAAMAICIAVAVSASAQLLSPLVTHGVVDTALHGNVEGARNTTFWKNTVYISGHPSGCTNPLFAFDVSNSSDLVFAARGGGGGCYFNKLMVLEDKLYVAAWDTMFKLFDVSDQNSISLLGEYDRPTAIPYRYYGWGIDAANDRAYVMENAENTEGLYIIDVSNPYNPTPVSWIDQLPLSGMGGMAVHGSYMYFGNSHFSGTPGASVFRLKIANISDETNPYIMKEIVTPNHVGDIKIIGDRMFVSCGGIIVYDISDPRDPVQLGSWSGVSGEMLLLGDFIWMATYGNGVVGVRISDPANMYLAAQPNYAHWNEREGSVTGNGRFVYISTSSDAGALPPDTPKESNLHALEVFSQDPDNEGPAKWSNVSLDDASWDIQYRGDALPSQSDPSWRITEDGGSESYAAAANGILRINDTGTGSGSKIRWFQNWKATNTRGTTTLVRARCASYSGSSSTYNVVVCDGRFTEEFSILSDKIRANRANLEYTLDGRPWRTYRITTKGSQFRVYVDENPTPVLTGPFFSTDASSNWARLQFGSGSSPATQDIYFDYVYGFSNGDYAPVPPAATTTPAVSVGVGDTAGKGSLSGIRPDSARVEWSSDGGATWSSSGGNRWDRRYQPGRLPSETSPVWTVAEGIESIVSINSGTLEINDNSTASNTKIKYAARWSASPSSGATVLVRAKCESIGGDTSFAGNIFVDNGVHHERFIIRPDRLVAANANQTYILPDSGEWHTYRVVMSGSTFSVYVDENPSPAMTGSLVASTEGSGARVMFGSGASAATQRIFFDSVRCSSLGAYAPGQAAQWNRVYNCSSLPAAIDKEWYVAEGSETYGSVASGILRVNDNSTQANTKIKWARDWNASSSVGTTVVAKVKCDSVSGDMTYVGNIYIEDGMHDEMFGIWPDRIEARFSGLSYTLPDSAQWHVYRVTSKGSQFHVYVDENPTPVISGTFTSSTTLNRVMFGSGASAATQDVYFEYVQYSTDGAFAPGQEEAGGPVTVSCSGGRGNDRGIISTSAIPFNQYSNHLNKMRFVLKDVNGNTGHSPVYGVRLDDPASPIPAPVTSFSAAPGSGQVILSWTNPASPSFSGTMIRYRTDHYPATPSDGLLVADKTGAPGMSDSIAHSGLTGGTTYYYSAFAHNSTPSYSSEANASATPTEAEAPEATIPQAKWLGDGESRMLSDKVVTAAFSGFFYIQEPDGYHGLKVLSADYVEPGWGVTVIGAMGGAGAERYIDCTGNVVQTNAAGPGLPTALAMSNKYLGGVDLGPYTRGVMDGLGPNNVGSLVRVWGKVTQMQYSPVQYLYIDDGSGIIDGTLTGSNQNVGVRIDASPSVYDIGDYLVVTGIVSLSNEGGNLIRKIVPSIGGIQKMAP